MSRIEGNSGRIKKGIFTRERDFAVGPSSPRRRTGGEWTETLVERVLLSGKEGRC